MAEQVNSITQENSAQAAEQSQQGIQATGVEQSQGTETTSIEQADGQHSIDLSKIDPSQLTPEQVAELQKGYMRQADYTKKTQEISTQKPNFAEVVQSPEFLDWAKSLGLIGQQETQAQAQEPEFLSSFTDEQKQALEYMFGQKIQPIVQSVQNNSITQQDTQLKTKYGEVYNPDIQKKVTSLQIDIAKGKGGIWREEAFKVVDYDNAIQRAFEAGKQEGLKGIQIRKQANLPQSSVNLNNTSQRLWDKNTPKQERLKLAAEAAEKATGVTFNEVDGKY